MEEILTDHGRTAMKRYANHALCITFVSCAVAAAAKTIYDVVVLHNYTAAAFDGILSGTSGLFAYGELREMRRVARASKR